MGPLPRALSILCIVKKISLAMVEAVVVMPSVTCTRLSLGEGGRRLYVRTEWLDAGFSVTALDFPQAWSCNGTYVGSSLFSPVSELMMASGGRNNFLPGCASCMLRRVAAARTENSSTIVELSFLTQWGLLVWSLFVSVMFHRLSCNSTSMISFHL